MSIENKFLEIYQWGLPSAETIHMKSEIIDPMTLKNSQILVKMQYASVHPADISVMRKNFTPHFSVKNNILPTKVGLEGAGIVEKVGQDVQQFKVGDAISVMDAQGKFQAFGQYVICEQGIKLPPSMNLLDGAQCVINPLTSIGILDCLGIFNFEPNSNKGLSEEYIAISGANSSVGQIQIQLAKQQGINIIALVRRQDIQDTMLNLGATKVLVTNEENTSQQLSSQLLLLTQNKGLRYAIDCVGGKVFEGLFGALGPFGHLVYFGNQSMQDMKIPAFSYRTIPKIEGFNAFQYFNKKGQAYKQKVLKHIFEEVSNQKIKLPIEKVYNFDQFLQAFNHQVRGAPGQSRNGKLLLKLDSQ